MSIFSIFQYIEHSLARKDFLGSTALSAKNNGKLTVQTYLVAVEELESKSSIEGLYWKTE